MGSSEGVVKGRGCQRGQGSSPSGGVLKGGLLGMPGVRGLSGGTATA